jgi:hypothetical protein
MRFITYMLENKVKYGVLRDEKTLVPIDELLDILPNRVKNLTKYRLHLLILSASRATALYMT